MELAAEGRGAGGGGGGEIGVVLGEVLRGQGQRLVHGRRVQRAGGRDVHPDHPALPVAAAIDPVQVELQASQVHQSAAPGQRHPGQLVQAQQTAAAAVDPHLPAKVRQHPPGRAHAQSTAPMPFPHRRGAHRQRHDRQQSLAGDQPLLQLGELGPAGVQIGRRHVQSGAVAQRVRGLGDRREQLGILGRAGQQGEQLEVVGAGDAQLVQQFRGRRRGQHHRDRRGVEPLGGVQGAGRVPEDLEAWCSAAVAHGLHASGRASARRAAITPRGRYDSRVRTSTAAGTSRPVPTPEEHEHDRCR